VVARERLLEAEPRLEVAHADLAAARGHQHVEHLHPVAVAERLEDAFEVDRLVVGERRTRERRAALQNRELLHASALYQWNLM
jgi:hypothetical protein